MLNSSVILPKVIEKIAALWGEDLQVLEETIFRNTVENFGLRLGGEG